MAQELNQAIARGLMGAAVQRRKVSSIGPVNRVRPFRWDGGGLIDRRVAGYARRTSAAARRKPQIRIGIQDMLLRLINASQRSTYITRVQIQSESRGISLEPGGNELAPTRGRSLGLVVLQRRRTYQDVRRRQLVRHPGQLEPDRAWLRASGRQRSAIRLQNAPWNIIGLVIVDPQQRSQRGLLQIVNALGTHGFRLGLGQGRQKERSKNRDDGDYNEELDKSERTMSTVILGHTMIVLGCSKCNPRGVTVNTLNPGNKKGTPEGAL